MRTVIVLLNRDLRVSDHPALATACRDATHVIPLFVVDAALTIRMRATGPRAAFLAATLRELREALRSRGGDIVIRRGDPVHEALTIARTARVDGIFTSADVSAYAQRRERELAAACAAERLAFRLFPGVSVVPADALSTKAGGHYRVFTPYWNAWQLHPPRALEPAPSRVVLPHGIDPGHLPSVAELGAESAVLKAPRAGESAGRATLNRFLSDRLGSYRRGVDDLALDATSRLGAYLHFGCLSPAEVAADAGSHPDSDAFVRQLCWRDYFHQLTHWHPTIDRVDLRSRGDDWLDNPEALAAWKEGVTGFPIIDAGMRQLRTEGWMPNRVRMLVASFLTKQLGIDWRLGAAHFSELLVDGDVANNYGNWQWAAGTGTDTRPNRVFNPTRQAQKHDPSGHYVRGHVVELESVAARSIHEPWSIPESQRHALRYPERFVDHHEAGAAFQERARMSRRAG
jgi:deoxyribodipyrimidine photo-lyase